MLLGASGGNGRVTCWTQGFVGSGRPDAGGCGRGVGFRVAGRGVRTDDGRGGQRETSLPNGPWQLETDEQHGNVRVRRRSVADAGRHGQLVDDDRVGSARVAQQLCVRRMRDDAVVQRRRRDDADRELRRARFSTNRASGTTMPSFNIEVYTTGVGSYTTFAFVPDAGSVVNSTWQSWDAMNPSDGVWYSSRNVGSGVFNCGPFSCSASWSQIMASYPNAKVVYGLGPNLGTGGTYTGNIDNFTVGLSGTTTVYDFEPDCTTTCYVDAANGNDNNTGLSGDPLPTIQAGINKVQSGGIAACCQRHVRRERRGQQVRRHRRHPAARPIVEPAVSNPNCGGAGGASLCTGASNVFLVQADNVTHQPAERRTVTTRH